MDSLADFIGSATGQITAGIVALVLFFWMAAGMIGGQHEQMQAQARKSGYRMCMQHSHNNAAYCGLVFPQFQK
jgi:hypothetical protein